MDCKDILTGDVMPVGAYYGPIISYTTKEWGGYTTENFLQDKYFQMITDCGLNVITTVDCDYADDPENFLKTMDLCEKYGIRIFVKDRELESLEGEEAIRRRMAPYSKYKCFAGIRVIDEPESAVFPVNTDKPNRELSFYCKVASKLNGIDGLLGYVNLFPYYASMEADFGKTMADYEAYVNTYSEGVPNLKLLSWDHYVFDFNPPRYDVYFENMSVCRELADRRNVPFWAFVQAGGQWHSANKPSVPYFPTEGQLTWNVNTCLAMGAKGIQYFPLVQPHWFSLNENGEIDSKRSGLIGADGSATPWFYMVKQSNAQIRAVDEYLMNAVHIGVLPVGYTPKAHTKNVKSVLSGTFRELTGVDAPKEALLGCFDYKGKTALYVVNYDQEESQTITLHFSKNCEYETICAQDREKMAGDACTFTLGKGGAKLILIG